MFIWFTPESPYWLVRKDREGDAVRVFTKLSGRSDNEQDAGNRVLLIRETNRIEKELS
jgi:SP family general alpha glucoside:H+ symporter-like MFS transporter